VLADAAIPLFGGIYATLLGFRLVGKKPGVSPKFDEWHDRRGALLRGLGPFLVLFSLWRGISGWERLTHASASIGPANWKRYSTVDGVCSAEFPGLPKQNTLSALDAQTYVLTLYLPMPDVAYTLTLRGCSKSGFFGKSPRWKGNPIPLISRTNNGLSWNHALPLPNPAGGPEKPNCGRSSMLSCT
jgi:hypothetical protein